MRESGLVMVMSTRIPLNAFCITEALGLVWFLSNILCRKVLMCVEFSSSTGTSFALWSSSPKITMFSSRSLSMETGYEAGRRPGKSFCFSLICSSYLSRACTNCATDSGSILVRIGCERVFTYVGFAIAAS